MKVLWFSNIPTGDAARYLNYDVPDIGGWIESLKNEILGRTNIELGIAFCRGDRSYLNFKSANVSYYKLPYLKASGRIAGKVSNLSHRLEDLTVLDYARKTIREFNPDLIQIFGTEGNFGLITGENTVPVVIHLQGILNEITKKYFQGISKFDIARYGDKRKLIFGSGLLHSYFIMKNQAKRELKIFRTCRHFLGRTDWDREIVRTYAPQSRYYHCDEVLREAFYHTSWTRQNSKKRTCLSTIRSSNYKGLEMLAQCSLGLSDPGGLGVSFRVAGISKADEVYKIVVRKYGKRVESFLVPLGMLTSDQIIGEMKSCDVFLHPSHADNSPNSLCEAMMLGIPIVATGAGGIPSLLKDGQEGFVTPTGDAEAMSEAIKKLLMDKNLADTFSANARKRAVARHDKGKIVRDLVSTYTSILVAGKAAATCQH